MVLKPTFKIGNIRPNSPAERVGLRKGDLLVSINGKRAEKYTLKHLINYFYKKEGEELKITVTRFGIPITVFLKLESPLK
jgi:C-terminal processing protease CtpA/Prc